MNDGVTSIVDQQIERKTLCDFVNDVRPESQKQKRLNGIIKMQ